jgi:hypothetical protein
MMMTTNLCLPGRGDNLYQNLCLPGREDNLYQNLCLPGRGDNLFQNFCLPGRGDNLYKNFCLQGFFYPLISGARAGHIGKNSDICLNLGKSIFFRIHF